MLNLDLILIIVILFFVLAFFIHGRLRVDLIAICCLAILLIFGLLPVDQALSGFTNQATATIAAMFVVSAGLVRTGLIQKVTSHLDKLAGSGEVRLILVLSIVVAVLSAFLLNTAVVAIFIPLAIVLARNRKIPSSRVLIPISFASQFGGVCTIIGTSTNMLVNGISVNAGMRPFGFFEFAPLGLVMVVAGVIYLASTSRWLLPKHKEVMEQVDKYRLADYLAELMVLPDSPIIDYTWEKRKICRDSNLELTNLFREGKSVSRPQRTKMRPGDLILLHGHIDKIMEMEQNCGLELLKNTKVHDEELNSHETRLIEVLIPPGSSIIGKTLRNSDFFRRYKANILAIQRRGQVLKDRLDDVELSSGDTLLIQGHLDDIPRLMNSTNLIITNDLSELHFRRDKVISGLLVMLIFIILAVFNIVPIMVAAILGALGMIFTRCITIEEAYDVIDWKIIFLLGGLIPLGLALEQHGVAQWLAQTMVGYLSVYGDIALLSSIYIITAILTAVMSNTATVAIMAPIAMTLAAAMNVDPRPFLIAITFAASTSFATPVGYQTNTMVYFTGGYRFMDFIRIGLPLNIVFFVLSILLIPLIWPL
ncbi:SLC13 family permease [Chloroflexota bacterium]